VARASFAEKVVEPLLIKRRLRGYRLCNLHDRHSNNKFPAPLGAIIGPNNVSKRAWVR
jgi:hypothetical protein